jgi:hypothetical protein
MIVSMYTGGAHCCLMDYVFELEPEFKRIALLDAEDSWPAYFDDLDHDGHFYYLAEDWTFAYWPSSFAGSPNHSVVLRYVEGTNGGGYHLAWDKMRRPPPTPPEWNHAMSAVRKDLKVMKSGYVSSIATDLWSEVMDLVYTGHSDPAWKFVDEAGPEAQGGNNPDLDDFCSRLKASPYWPDIQPTLINTPPACANAKPERLE